MDTVYDMYSIFLMYCKQPINNRLLFVLLPLEKGVGFDAAELFHGRFLLGHELKASHVRLASVWAYVSSIVPVFEWQTILQVIPVCDSNLYIPMTFHKNRSFFQVTVKAAESPAARKVDDDFWRQEYLGIAVCLAVPKPHFWAAKAPRHEAKREHAKRSMALGAVWRPGNGLGAPKQRRGRPIWIFHVVPAPLRQGRKESTEGLSRSWERRLWTKRRWVDGSC